MMKKKRLISLLLKNGFSITHGGMRKDSRTSRLIIGEVAGEIWATRYLHTGRVLRRAKLPPRPTKKTLAPFLS